MPRRADEIVAEIRAKRHRVTADLSDLTTVRELERRIRHAPEVWLLGGALAGLISARFFSGPLFELGHRKVRNIVWSRVRSGLVTLGVALTSAVAGKSGDGVGTWSADSDPATSRRSGEREARRS